MEIIKRIKNKIKRILLNYNELKKLKKYIDEGKGIYKFSPIDFELYKMETKQRLKHKKSEIVDENLVKITIKNHQIFWPNNISDVDLPWLHHEIFDNYEFNPSSYSHPKMKYEDAEWVIDAGCCEGYFSLFAFEKNRTVKVFAFEPLREMEIPLKKTFSKEVQEKRFILEQKAIGAEQGIVQFQFDSIHLCDSCGVEKLKENHKNTSYNVNVVNLDSLIDLYTLGKNGIIKMDIEGSEMDALIGGVELMRKYQPKLAIAVYHNYENALKCRDIILNANSKYTVEFRGMYGYFEPPRPYIVFAW